LGIVELFQHTESKWENQWRLAGFQAGPNPVLCLTLAFVLKMLIYIM